MKRSRATNEVQLYDQDDRGLTMDKGWRFLMDIQVNGLSIPKSTHIIRFI